MYFNFMKKNIIIGIFLWLEALYLVYVGGFEHYNFINAYFISSSVLLFFSILGLFLNSKYFMICFFIYTIAISLTESYGWDYGSMLIMLINTIIFIFLISEKIESLSERNVDKQGQAKN